MGSRRRFRYVADTGLRWCTRHDGVVDVDEDECDISRRHHLEHVCRPVQLYRKTKGA